MSNEELLIKRRKIIAPYPHMAFEVDTVLMEAENGELYSIEQGYSPTAKIVTAEEADTMPHLFKLLAWYEEREVEDLPEYVKFHDYNGLRVIKGTSLTKGKETDQGYDDDDIGKHDFWFGSTHVSCFQPATIEDYNAFNTQNKTT